MRADWCPSNFLTGYEIADLRFLQSQIACGLFQRHQARELIERVDGLSIEALRAQAGAAGDRDRTAGP